MFLGVLSIFQVLFLPGFLCFRLVRVKAESLVETLVIVVSLSLIFNYLYAYLLSVLGFYSRASVLGLLAVELIISGILLVRDMHLRKSMKTIIFQPASVPTQWQSASLVIFAYSAALLSAIAAIKVSLRFNVFNAWDALFSWNRWAYAWTSGVVPNHVEWYPQLIPANWSMMYLLSGSQELQLFPLSIMPWFGIAILLMFLDLGLRRRRIDYLGALLLCLVAVFGLKSILLYPFESMIGGYVDLPLTFFVSGAFYLLELRDNRCPSNWKQLALPLLVACGAAVTKANGMYAVAVVLVLALIGHLRAHQELSIDEWVKSGSTVLATLLLIPGSWYGVKALDILAGRDMSNHAILSEAVDSSGGIGGPFARLVHAASLFPHSWVMVAVMLIAVVIAVTVSRTRWVALGIFLPYSLLWAFFLSYDLRNWIVMIPVLAYIASLGVGGLIEHRFGLDLSFSVEKKSYYIAPTTILAGATVLLIGVGFISFFYPNSRLVAAELDHQRRIGDAKLNETIYEAFSKVPSLRGELLTDYPYLQFLPDFRSDPTHPEHSTQVNVQYVFRKALTVEELKGKKALVLSNQSSPEVQSLINQKIKSGEYSVISTYTASGIVGYDEISEIKVIRVNKQD